MASRAAMMQALLLAALAVGSARAQLHEKFYSESCPSVEAIVRKELVSALSTTPNLAAALLRMHFHDCFVRVSLLSTLSSLSSKPKIFQRPFPGPWAVS